MPIYLDHAATTPLLPQALAAMEEGFRIWANPSSPHKAGRAARAALEDARARIKAALGWDGEVIFTSGASEALEIATKKVSPGKHLQNITSAVEHEAVLRLTPDAVRLGVEADGLVRISELEQVLVAGGPALVAIQQVNSETGVVQDLGPVAVLAKSNNALLLVDAAQGAGKLGLPQADMIALSAHKFGGPVGIGALLVREYGLLHPGGGQERGYRAGTEPLPQVLGMAAALEAGNAWLKCASGLRESLESQLLELGGEVIAANAPRSPTIGAYRMPGKSSAAQLIRFDGAGIAVSAGSACSSGSLKASHVLTAMGVAGLGEVIRVSIGRETTEAEIARFVDVWREIRG
ncbi:aminotransferase class V-fold PLP-dependent enzyme [Novosphingobium sp. MMS21-SN21R]|uniref:cysteine desulfurase family protein n=1 Tax=Novosphingobium sp. MMS21-SN21R TaxID=2969298 RepID=UPI00288531E1|nr:aminotransferase class V-fold PLP-dependent enzyme [Novosphingobium sp. MMS21-SN21R]MDT0509049.1 aminotransferase class V-fold PLP-dependent enzyme [Novosphingobium sp. MMS21-SN21R]